MTFLFSETVCISGDLKLLSSPLVSWCFSLFGEDVDSSGCASLSVWWGEQALFHLTLIWALKMSWVNYGPEVSLPALHEKCFRCRWWQKWGEMSPCQRVCSVFAQPLMVPVGFAECTVQSSCLLSGCHATPQGAGPVGGLSKQGEPERGLTQGLCHNISAFCTSKERFTAAAPWHSEIKGFLFPSITLWSLCLHAAYLSLIMFIMAMHTIYESKSFPRLSSALKFNNKV